MVDSLTYIEVLERASSFLDSKKKDTEAALWLLLNRLNWSKTDWVLNFRNKMPIDEQAQFESDIRYLLEDYPPQYILGKADFFGREFKVTSDTLIPRPETEELVELCLKTVMDQTSQILDIGTGSGAIAVTLKKERPLWNVFATDISEEALLVARENARRLNTVVEFQHGNLIEPVEDKLFDVIISNPPYISYNEKELMGKSVIKYEPHVALFAEHEGLYVYEQLASTLPIILKPDGKVFLEIGFAQGDAVKKLFETSFPNKNISVKKDLSGKDRFVTVT